MNFVVVVVVTLLLAFASANCDAFLTAASTRSYVTQNRPQKMDYLTRTFSGVMQIFGGKEKIVLLIIDPQVDFHPGGSLAVPGANQGHECDYFRRTYHSF
jgi:hypothetical protein